MHYNDNSKYDGTDLPIYTVGWLDQSESFLQGELEIPFLQKLISIYKRERVNLTRGTYPCYFCYNSGTSIIEDTDIYLTDGNNSEILGMAEIWIPNSDRTKIFVAPDLIIHYIAHHSYQPPEEFVDAVCQFDLSSNWSGDEAYRKYLKTKFPDFQGW